MGMGCHGRNAKGGVPVSALTAFEYEGETVRVIMIDQRPHWVAVDISGILGYTRAPDMVRRIPAHQKKLHVSESHRDGPKRNLTVLTEGGVYRAVINSERPEAEKFVDWITDEVLPSLRANGRYEMPGQAIAAPVEDDDPLLADLSLEQRLALVNSARLIHGKKGAAAIWRRVGLPDPNEEGMIGLDVGAASDPRYASINEWIIARCDFVPGHMEESSALHADYRLWCANNGQAPEHITTFGLHLKRRGVPGRKSGRIWRIGLKLKPVAALVSG